MSYRARAKDLRVKLFRSNTISDMESKINTWLSNSEEEFEVVDMTFQRNYNPVTEKTINTAVVIFRLL